MLASDVNGRAVYFIMLSLGMAMLLAYNAFISSPDYVEKYYRFAAQDATLETKMPDFWRNMETYIVIASMIPNFILQAYVVSPHGQRLPIHKRILFSTVALTVAILVVACLPLAKPSEEVAAGVFLAAVCLAGASTAFFQSSAFGMASMLSDRFVQATMLGIGISGSVTSGMQIIIKAAVGDPDFKGQQSQANIFFGLAIAWLVICIGMIVVMPDIEFLKRRLPEYGGDLDYERKERPSLIDDDSVEASPLTRTEGVQAAGPLRVLKCIWPLMLANFGVYLVSLTIFPQLCANASNGSYFPVVIIFLFNFGDTCGRFVCRFKQVHVGPRFLLPMSLARFVFVPLIILSVHPKVIPGYVLPCIFLFLVGVSNGFTSSLCMMYGPTSSELRDDERAQAGSAMSFSLLGGCSAGSLVALLVNAYVKPN